MTCYERIQLPDGRRAFRKYLASGSSGQFLAEAGGLRALAASAAVATPGVIAADATEIVTELVVEGAPSEASWSRLGESLAAMQAAPQPCFGFSEDNYCGATRQLNPHTVDGHDFFAEQRLLYQGRLAGDRGLLQINDVQRLEALCGQLPRLIPRQSPALLHGDLWRGNLLFDGSGEAVLIDPACYWGWPEAEIAMTSLFGGFPDGFYRHWESAAQPEPDWRERLPLYNLYHLLNHLNLFGDSYYSAVREVLDSFR